MSAVKFEKRVLVEPGYDHCDDVGDTRGAHNLYFRFILVGPLGAISWHLNTGWMKRPLAAGYDRASGKQERLDKPGADFRLRDTSPRAGAVSSHARTQLTEYMVGPYPCDLLGGECYGDTGYLVGDRVLEAMFDRGHDGVWEELASLYREWLANPEVEL